MKIVADEGVDRGIVTQLREEAHSVVYIAEVLRGADDVSVLKIASESISLLITSDKDFGELVYRQKLVAHGVLLLRLAGLSGDRKARLVAQTVARHGITLTTSFSVLAPNLFRMRPLEPH